MNLFSYKATLLLAAFFAVVGDAEILVTNKEEEKSELESLSSYYKLPRGFKQANVPGNMVGAHVKKRSAHEEEVNTYEGTNLRRSHNKEFEESKSNNDEISDQRYLQWGNRWGPYYNRRRPPIRRAPIPDYFPGYQQSNIRRPDIRIEQAGIRAPDIYVPNQNLVGYRGPGRYQPGRGYGTLPYIGVNGRVPRYTANIFDNDGYDPNEGGNPEVPVVVVPTPAPQPPTEPPTSSPTLPPQPTLPPTSAEPTLKPTIGPTTPPTRPPTGEPTLRPSLRPTAEPTIEPTRNPTREPTRKPTRNPTRKPTRNPTRSPTDPNNN